MTYQTFIGILNIFLVLCLSSVSVFAQGAGTALDFESDDADFVSTGSDASLQILGDLSLEVWLNPETIQNQVILYQGGGPGDAEADNVLYSIELESDGTVSFVHEYGAAGGRETLTSTSTISAGTWTHLAIVRDTLNNQIYFYFNGVSETVGYTEDATGGTASIGSVGAADVVVITYLPYDGLLDEVRIWNDIRTQAEIRNNMNQTISGSSANLVAYWTMNDGSGQTMTDSQSSGNNDGTLGSTGGVDIDDPAWVVSTAPIGESGAYVATTTQTNVGPVGGEIQVTITSTPDDDNKLFVYQSGDPDGMPVTSGETFPSGFDRRSNLIWGVREIGAVTATIVFDYSNQIGIDSPADIEILVRDNAGDSSWEEVIESSRNDVTRTITLTGVVDYFEYTIGGNPILDNPLPVDLLSFDVTSQYNSIDLQWQTAAEINNLGYEIYRAVNSPDNFNIIASYRTNKNLSGQHNSSTGAEYNYQDFEVQDSKTYYYKLIQHDSDGSLNLIAEEELEFKSTLPNQYVLYQNYPNPFNQTTRISFNIPEQNNTELIQIRLEVYNTLGQKVRTLINHSMGSGEHELIWDGKNDAGMNLPSSNYFLLLRSKNIMISKKMILSK